MKIYPEGNELSLAATGDFPCNMRISCFTDDGFISVIDILRAATVTYTHLTTLFHNYEGYPAAESGGTWQRSPPFIVNELKWAGFNLVSCADNHTLDYSYQGLLSTMKILDEAGIVYAGVGNNLGEAREPKYLETSNGRVALISICSTFARWARAGDVRRDMQGRPGMNPLRYYYVVNSELMKDIQRVYSKLNIWSEILKDGKEVHFFRPGLSNTRIRFMISDEPGVYTKCNELDLDGNIASIKDARRQADYVFVAYHGHECVGGDREIQMKFQLEFAHACIDAGADAFLGAGPHLLRGIEIYKGKPIFYSLGNLIRHSHKITRLPADFYERFGLDWDATPSDGFEGRERHNSDFVEIGMGSKLGIKEYESIVALPTFNNGELTGIKLYPLWLSGKPKSQMRFSMAVGDVAKRIINRLSELSSVYGTEIEYKDGIGFVKI